MNVIAVYNIKGGVGKTATAVNLAWLAARDGARTLVWDLDPQAAASFYFRVKPRLEGGGKRLFKLLHAKQGADRHIKGTDFENLHLLPADFVYRNMDLVLDDWKKPTNRLRKVLRSVTGDYDIAFLDCPPSISLVSENIFHAADVMLVPVIPTTLSLRTLEQVLEFVKKPELRGLRVYPFFSMVDRRKRLHCEITESLPRVVRQTLEAQIPYASDVERMGVRRAPLSSFMPPSNPAVRAYDALWQELKERLYATSPRARAVG